MPTRLTATIPPKRRQQEALLDHRRITGNRLAGETSPYLLQHADNPVHWWPWCDAAFEDARLHNKPVLLSVGYSACHWCHVMAHESFEDAEIAAQMNQQFVNIKVDREEHPEVDAIYQEALSLMDQHGGWPLTMFLTPAREPFWGGTYFPKAPAFGRPGFSSVLSALSDAFATKADKIEENRAALARHMTGRHAADRSGSMSSAALIEAGGRFLGLFDPINGGLKGAPKFPQPAILGLIWECWHRTGDPAYLEAHNLSLERICQGGIYDHLGGGFARYAVDDKWLVPHFEKMLYDNALLIEALTRAWQSTRNPLFRTRVEETVGWLLREMTVEGAEGRAFAAALDADSEGVEGRFYVWTQSQIDEALGNDADLFSRAYAVSPTGNWESVTILNRLHEAEPPAAGDELTLATCRAKLLALRDKRVRPGRDDKVLADWNGLAITALALAARVFSRPEWYAAAASAFSFVCREMAHNVAGDDSKTSPHLSHSWCGYAAPRPALLDDYASMIRAALTHAETLPISRSAHLLDKAEGWASVLQRDFHDAASGGFNFAPRQASDLVLRARHAHDGPVPSGNALAAEAFTRLAARTGKRQYAALASAAIEAFAGEAHTNIFPHAGLFTAYSFLEAGLEIIVIGEEGDPLAQQVISVISNTPLPNYSLMMSSSAAALPADHPAHGKTGPSGTVYLCRRGRCSLPIIFDPDHPAALADALSTEISGEIANANKDIATGTRADQTDAPS